MTIPEAFEKFPFDSKQYDTLSDYLGFIYAEVGGNYESISRTYRRLYPGFKKVKQTIDRTGEVISSTERLDIQD